jgi:formylglycine-generating enzyme required for sulfatase activity
MSKFNIRLSIVAFLGLLAVGSPCWSEQYVFLVGVADYSQNQMLTSLKYAEDDVHALADLFATLGVPKQNIVVMSKRAASAENAARYYPKSNLILEELKGLLSLMAQEDSIIVGFSGHGLQFKGDSTNYYCPIDAYPAPNRKETLISLPEVYQMLVNSKARIKVLLVDACRDNPLNANAKTSTRIEIEPVRTRPAPVFDGAAVAIFSCSEMEQSFEDETIKSGVFFHYVQSGLSGAADENEDGAIDVMELSRYATRNVKKHAFMKLKRDQTPEWMGKERGMPELIRYREKTAERMQPKLKDADNEIQAIRNQLDMQLVAIPAGKFRMGSPSQETGRYKDEEPHEVTISRSFYMSVTEVTQAQYEALRLVNPSVVRGPQQPVESITWEEATNFCKALSELPQEKAANRVYRLPTEAEWEYAARSGQESAYHFGNQVGGLGDYACFRGNANVPQQVRTKKANGFGLFDMYGNVYEWCSDWYADDLSKLGLRDPQGPPNGSEKVMRGGSFREDAKYLRSASRIAYPPKEAKPYCGFRVVMEIAGQP